VDPNVVVREAQKAGAAAGKAAAEVATKQKLDGALTEWQKQQKAALARLGEKIAADRRRMDAMDTDIRQAYDHADAAHYDAVAAICVIVPTAHGCPGTKR